MRPPQARSGNQSSSAGVAASPGRSPIASTASRKAVVSRSAKRPCGIPSWVESAMKWGIGRGLGATVRSVSQGFAQIGGRSLGRIDVDVDAGAELEAGLDRQAGGD